MNTEKLVQVKRGANGRMSRYTPHVVAKVVEPKKLTHQEFIEALREAGKVKPAIGREGAKELRIAAEKLAITLYVGWNDSLPHGVQLDTARRQATYQINKD